MSGAKDRYGREEYCFPFKYEKQTTYKFNQYKKFSIQIANYENAALNKL